MKNYKAKTLLVTGGAGFIGSNFVRHMLRKYDDIRIINYDKLTYAGSLKNLEELPNSNYHHFIQGDICDTAQLSKILRQYNIDTVVHFAAESHVDRSIENPTDFIQTNVVGTLILLEAAKQFWLAEKKWGTNECRFHHISTDEVFGSLGPNDPAFNEQSAYKPNSPYSASKASSDHLVRAFFHTYGLPVTLSHCSNNYGPYQHAEKFIPTVIKACKEWKTIPLYGDGSNIRDWLHVEDHCHAIELILQRGTLGESYTIGGNNELSNAEVVNGICDLMDELNPKGESHRSLINFVEDRAGHDWRYAINNHKISTELNWEAKIPFLTGTKQLII